MSQRYSYDCVITREADGYVASFPQLPGCFTDGDTREEADASRGILPGEASGPVIYGCGCLLDLFSEPDIIILRLGRENKSSFQPHEKALPVFGRGLIPLDSRGVGYLLR